MIKNHRNPRLLCGALCFGLLHVVPAWSAPQDNWGYERSIKAPAGKAFGLDKYSRLALDLSTGDLLLSHEIRFVDRIHPTNGTTNNYQSYITGVLPTSADEVLMGLAVVGSTVNGPMVVFPTKGTNNSSLISPKQLRLTDGLQSVEFGPFGVNDGQLQVPTGIAVRPGNDVIRRLYILDLHGRRITVWDIDPASATGGNLPTPVWKFNAGSSGTANGQFAFMWGDNNRADIATGPDGRIYVYDWYVKRIQVFVDTGNRIDWVKTIRIADDDWFTLFPWSTSLSENISCGPDGILAVCGVLIDPALVPDGQTDPIGKDHPAILGRIKYYPPNQAVGGEADYAAFFHPTNGCLYVINGLTDQIDVYRRGYRTFGSREINHPPTPVVESIVLTNGLVQAKFRILDPDDTNLSVAALLAPIDSPVVDGADSIPFVTIGRAKEPTVSAGVGTASVLDMVPITNGFGVGSVTLPNTNLFANSNYTLYWTPPAGFTAGNYRLFLLAKDRRYFDRNTNGVRDAGEERMALVDVDFIQLPATTNGQPQLRLSRSPVKKRDLVAVWQWLRATGDSGFVWGSNGVTVSVPWSSNGVTVGTNEILFTRQNATTRKGRDRLLSSFKWRVATYDEWLRTGNMRGRLVEWGSQTWDLNHTNFIPLSPTNLLEVRQIAVNPHVPAPKYTAGGGVNALLTSSNTLILGGDSLPMDLTAPYNGEQLLGNTLISANLQGVAQIAMGAGWYACRMSNGTVRVYGQNHATNATNSQPFGRKQNFGGLDLISNRPAVPARIQGVQLSNIVSIAAGAYYGLALQSDGRVYCWGEPPDYQRFGTGSGTNFSTNRIILTNTSFTGLSASTVGWFALDSFSRGLQPRVSADLSLNRAPQGLLDPVLNDFWLPDPQGGSGFAYLTQAPWDSDYSGSFGFPQKFWEPSRFVSFKAIYYPNPQRPFLVFGVMDDGTLWMLEMSSELESYARWTQMRGVSSGGVRDFPLTDVVAVEGGPFGIYALNSDGSVSQVAGINAANPLAGVGSPSTPAAGSADFSKPSGVMALAVGGNHAILWQNQEENGLDPLTVRMGDRPVLVNSLGFERVPYAETLNIWVVDEN